MFNYTVEKTIATIGSSGNSEKRLTVTSWNGNPAKLDLRTWRTVDGEQTPGKGMTLTNSEAAALCEALAEYLKGADNG